MNKPKPGILAELFGLNLAGWKITYCFFLEINHCNIGMFPAVDDNGKPIVVLNKRSLKKVWEKLPRRSVILRRLVTIAHSEIGIAFNLENDIITGNVPPLKIFSDDEIAILCQNGSVHWAKGQVPLIELPPNEPDFD